MENMTKCCLVCIVNRIRQWAQWAFDLRRQNQKYYGYFCWRGILFLLSFLFSNSLSVFSLFSPASGFSPGSMSHTSWKEICRKKCNRLGGRYPDVGYQKSEFDAGRHGHICANQANERELLFFCQIVHSFVSLFFLSHPKTESRWAATAFIHNSEPQCMASVVRQCMDWYADCFSARMWIMFMFAVDFWLFIYLFLINHVSTLTFGCWTHASHLCGIERTACVT